MTVKFKPLSNIKRKFLDGGFSQQSLKTDYPLYTADIVWPWLIAIGILFMAIGIPIIVLSDLTKELEIDYTDCTSIEDPKQACHELVYKDTASASCQCQLITEKIGSGWTKDVMVRAPGLLEYALNLTDADCVGPCKSCFCF